MISEQTRNTSAIGKCLTRRLDGGDQTTDNSVVCEEETFEMRPNNKKEWAGQRSGARDQGVRARRARQRRQQVQRPGGGNGLGPLDLWEPTAYCPQASSLVPASMPPGRLLLSGSQFLSLRPAGVEGWGWGAVVLINSLSDVWHPDGSSESSLPTGSSAGAGKLFGVTSALLQSLTSKVMKHSWPTHCPSPVWAKDRLPNSCQFPHITSLADTCCIWNHSSTKDWCWHPGKSTQRARREQEGARETERERKEGKEGKGDCMPGTQGLWKATLAPRIYQHFSPSPPFYNVQN